MSAIALRTRNSRPAPPYRKGWCPGALKPMETADGLLVRVRAPRGRLSLDQAAALADAAIACGNGAIGLTARANLHLRGLSEGTLPNLHARLEDAGLIDADPEIERLCNIVASPLDDIDPEALLDLGPGVATLEKRLKEDEALRRLPAKFGFVLDAFGRLPLGDVEADIRFEASRDGTLAVFLAGDDALAAQCAHAETGDVAARLGLAFLALADAGEAALRRMRALVERTGAPAVFAEAGCDTKPRRRSPRWASLRDVLGAHAYGVEFVAGAAAAFGEIEAVRLKAVIERARALNARSLRLTPWRALLITGLDQHGAESLVVTIAELGLLVDPDDPRLRVAACPGAPACMHGHRSVRDDGTRWAATLPRGGGVILHVSGCAKGCARPAVTAATFTATATGYDLVLGGRAGDPPVRRSLSSAEVMQLLANEGAGVFAAERLS
jgi:precorrin-3B synthase